MHIATNPLALIGNTPLVRLEGPSAETGCEILAKCEYANPGASVKDRAALYIIEDAEERGVLKPGAMIVEGTAGNTGIGLALVANAKGYRTTIVMPETQSREKMDTLRALGAELVLVPAAPFSNPGHFVHTSRRIAEETPGALWANQFDNIANRKAHIHGTAEEIWEQTEGRVDGFTGIGQGRITANLDGAPVDTQFRISDEEGLYWVRRLLHEEGLCLGLSSGINVAGAVALARKMGPGKTIVTVLCDTGFRYLSTLYNPEWLQSKGLSLFSPPAE